MPALSTARPGRSAAANAAAAGARTAQSTPKPGRAAPATPAPPPRSELSDADLSLFFRILRFLSSHPQLASLSKAAESTEAASGVGSNALNTPAASVQAGSVVAGRQRGLTGSSVSVSNRIRIPPALRDPLEEFRMLATNTPIDEKALAASREVVCTLLAELCDELGDRDISQQLQEKVFADGADDADEVDLGSPALPCSVTRRASAFGSDGLQQMQEVVPGLWCSSYHPAADKALMQRHGITHVCCCIGTQPRFPGDFMYMTLSADDRPDYDMTPHFAHTFEFIENALVKNHGGVLVHCGAGISRAPTIVAAYLMRKLRLSSSAAIALVQRHRACASPNMGFRRQLHGYGVQIGVNEKAAEARAELANESFARAANAVKN